MNSVPAASPENVLQEPLRVQLEAFVDEHRSYLLSCLGGLTEQQARRSMVPSRTTLLGLVKHATFVEKVWFAEAVTGQARAELGIASTPDASFQLDEADTIASVTAAYQEAWRCSHAAIRSIGLDDRVSGNRRGPLPLRWILLHVLRELAQHCGHADILREQILAS